MEEKNTVLLSGHVSTYKHFYNSKLPSISSLKPSYKGDISSIQQCILWAPWVARYQCVDLLPSTDVLVHISPSQVGLKAPSPPGGKESASRARVGGIRRPLPLIFSPQTWGKTFSSRLVKDWRYCMYVFWTPRHFSLVGGGIVTYCTVKTARLVYHLSMEVTLLHSNQCGICQ